MDYFKRITLFCLFVLLSGSTAAIYGGAFDIFGNLNMFAQSGEAADYVPGQNDFPIAQSHTSYGFGCAYISNTEGSVYFGLELDYNLNSTTVVVDPSDNDTAEIDTYQNLMGFFILGVRVIKTNQLSFAINGGGGGYYILDAEQKEYTTSKGYILRILPPDKEIGLSFFGGGSLAYMFSSKVGLVLSARYQYIASEYPQSAIILQLGLRFAF